MPDSHVCVMIYDPQCNWSKCDACDRVVGDEGLVQLDTEPLPPPPMPDRYRHHLEHRVAMSVVSPVQGFHVRIVT